MNIVLDARTATNHFPGIGRYVFNLARSMIPLLEADEQLTLLYDPASPTPWDLTALTGQRIRLVQLPVSPFSLRQQWVLPQLLRSLGASLYHSPYYLMPYRPGVPTVVTVHDLIPQLYPLYFTSTQRLIFNFTIRLAARTACQLITVSQSSASDLAGLAWFPATPISVITEAADPIFRSQPVEAVAALRRRLDLPEQYALYVGSNKPHKNLVRLVEAWAIVKRKSQIANSKLVIAGVWDARYPQAKIRVEELGLRDSVRFLGPVAEADLPALYSGATIFVFPSEYEGFGLPVLEAMACGVPVACADTSSLIEIAGDAALSFEPAKVEAIAEALCLLLNDADRQNSSRQRGLQQAALYSWQETAQQSLAVYRNLHAS